MGRKVWVPTVSGPLAPYAAGFESWLASRAYSPSAMADRLYQFDQLSRWLERQGLAVEELTDDQVERFAAVRQAAEREIAVDEEVRRRLGLLGTAGPAQPGNGFLTPAEIRDITQELADLADQIRDERLRNRLKHVCSRIGGCAAAPERRTGQAVLAPREIDVLEQIALGHSNREAADNLGLLPNTVKSYLKTAMRKLQANNRIQAIIAARDSGMIR